MHWNDFLLANGARIEGGKVTDFGNPGDESNEALNGNIMADLSQLAIVEFSGTDAEDFLHNQFTSDLKQLPVNTLQFSAWCNPQGRVLFNFFILKLKNNFFLLLPDELAAQFTKRLQMFVLRADVVISDNSNELSRIGLSGVDIEKWLPDLIKTVPSTPGEICQTGELICVRLPDKKQRFIIMGKYDVIEKLWGKLTAHITPVGTQQWELLDILAGFPWINTECTEKFLPQSLNLDELGGLSHQKGCYPGQEIIARVYHRGQVKRRLFIASVEPTTRPDIGDDLYFQGEDQSIGKILNVQPHPEVGYMMLIVVEIDKAHSEHIYLKDHHGPLHLINKN